LRGRRGTYGTGLALVARLGLAGAAVVCVAGVALGDMAWHLATWTVTSRGRCGTYGTGLALVARLGLAGAAVVCVAGVALGDIGLPFACQTCHLATWTFTLRGWRGTYGTGLALVARLGLAGAAVVRVAGVALGDIDLHFAWQAWHLVTSTCTLRGRRGTYGTGLALVARLGLAGAAVVCVAGVALGDIDLHFACQGRHLVTSTCTLRGRRGTYGTGLARWRAWVWHGTW